MRMLRSTTTSQVVGGLSLLLLLSSTGVRAATVPSGFSEVLVAGGLTSPTAMQLAPDGRIFVCEQAGRLRVIKNGQLLPTPFLTVTVSAIGERGLLGVAFDPNFAVNQFVYVYYTATSPTIHNRVSRFTANGDVAVAGSETMLLDLETLTATNHNGGALAFGADGKLYVAVGENAVGSNAQSLNNRLGKMLRVNPDGSIPTDNPFYTTATGVNRAIWALGLRNPFTFAFNATGSRLFINDVGQGSWEEVNDGARGANYGWPDTEGATTDPRFESPIYTYGRGGGVCAITGGAFYTPSTVKFPAGYVNDYFFADYCAGWIRKIEPAGGTAFVTFATGIPSPVDLKVSDDGALYYLARGSGGSTGVVYRIEYVANAPSITSHPTSRTVSPGAPVTFSVRASGTGTLRYQWQRNGADISGATSQDYAIASVTTADNGARFRARVTNDFGNVLSNEAVLTVTSNRGPTATISQPVAGTLYSGGNTIAYAGNGTDPEDGTLPASAFTWRVDFHHDTHTHPFIAPTTGARSGSFTIPTTGETSANVWYRIYLTVRDSAGAAHSAQRDVRPRTVNLTLGTSPPGLQLRLDSQPIATPATVASVVGVLRTLDAPATQTAGSTTYQFVSWSDGGAASHTISTPASNATYTATYRVASGGGGTGTGLSATYFNTSAFGGSTVSRVDPTVNFTWAAGAPATGIDADTFSVRWTGQVEAPTAGTYTFYTVSDDGVRLWVNGQQLVNRWTNHAAIEDSGAVTLSAGRYPIAMEYYENTGQATARLLWSGPSIAKAVVPSTRLYPHAGATPGVVRINFQPAASPVPGGYLADSGQVFGARGNGYSYGWNADSTSLPRDRNAAMSPDQAYDTLTHMQQAQNPNAVWEIALANGSYSVRIVAGDPSYLDSTYRIAAEGVLVASGTPTSTARWVDGTSTVTVADGRLTISNAAGSSNNKICFVVITPQ
jgi:glucose/arabinose dehydrogenase